MTALVTDGAYYFDSVPPGRYKLHFYSSDEETSRGVTVVQDKLEMLNLTSSNTASRWRDGLRRYRRIAAAGAIPND